MRLHVGNLELLISESQLRVMLYPPARKKDAELRYLSVQRVFVAESSVLVCSPRKFMTSV